MSEPCGPTQIWSSIETRAGTQFRPSESHYRGPRNWRSGPTVSQPWELFSVGARIEYADPSTSLPGIGKRRSSPMIVARQRLLLDGPLRECATGTCDRHYPYSLLPGSFVPAWR